MTTAEITSSMGLQDGSLEIYHGKRDTYYGHYYIPVTDENGEMVRRHKKVKVGYVSNLTKTQAREELRKKIREHFAELGQPIFEKVKAGTTLKKFVDEVWLPMKKGDWRPHTRNTNLRLIAKITDGPFGERTLDNITHRELKIWFDEVAPKNGHDQIRQMIGFLKQIYAYAVDEDYVKGDPGCYRLKMPSQANEVSRPVLDLKELATLQRGLADLPKGDALAVMTGSLTGMRPSELLSLRVKSFNEAGCILSITETEYLDSGPRIKVGKTKKSIRDVSISAELALRLRDWIKFEHPNPQPESFLFPARDGQLRWKSKAFLALVLYKLGKDLGIKVNFQILRRTVATLLAQEHEAVQPGQGTRKEMLAEIKQQFGHSQNSKVLEVAYIQDTPEKRANIAERFQLMLKAQVEKLQSASE